MSKTLEDYAALARELLSYDAESGLLTWRQRRGGSAVAGAVAGTHRSDGYIRVSVAGKLFLAHRLAWCLHHGKWPEGEIDHIDGDKANNRIENLRVVSHVENARNCKKSSNNTSGTMGVYRNRQKQRWVAEIGNTRSGTYRYLGCFTNKADAIAARQKAETDLGYHENHGRD